MNKTITASILGTALAASVSAAGSAQTTVAYNNPPPVEVVRYSVEPARSFAIPSGFGGFMSVGGSGNITITFVNDRDVAAKRVRFAVRSGNTVENIVDSGTFATGTGITHEYSLDDGLGSSAAVEVENVTFADGTVWQRQ
jgi:hypothetical protein